MTVRNRELERINSNCTPAELAAALGALDLKNAPLEKRRAAVFERIAQVMLHTTTDPRERAKDAFVNTASTYLARKAAGHQTSSGLILPPGYENEK